MSKQFHAVVGCLVVVVVSTTLPVMMKIMFDPGKSFEKYKELVKITNTNLTFGQTDCGPNLVVLGTFKNNSDVTWKDLQLEVQFFDKEGKLIDTGQKNEYSFVLQAKSEAPFKVSLKKEFSTEEYVSHSVKVLTAKDAKAMF